MVDEILDQEWVITLKDPDSGVVLKLFVPEYDRDMSVYDLAQKLSKMLKYNVVISAEINKEKQEMLVASGL